jgi:hypothetical protein
MIMGKAAHSIAIAALRRAVNKENVLIGFLPSNCFGEQVKHMGNAELVKGKSRVGVGAGLRILHFTLCTPAVFYRMQF